MLAVIQCRISSSSSVLSKNVKIQIYKTTILPVVLYEYEIWVLTLREQHRLRGSENRLLRKIIGPKREKIIAVEKAT
jgi:hypothetical protein